MALLSKLIILGLDILDELETYLIANPYVTGNSQVINQVIRA